MPSQIQTSSDDAATDDSTLGFAALRAEAIRQLERLAGGRWTDFNQHDPGITILEQLCYALTDLSYRIGFDVPDLLATSGDPARSLYTAGQVLASEPVTPADFRKLILDVPGVRNAWIEPAGLDPPYRYTEELDQISMGRDSQGEPVALKGLYRVLIHGADSDGSAVARAVGLRLHAHRNLCEDFTEIRALEPTPVALQASIEIAQVDDAEELLAEIYLAVGDYLAPSVQFRTLDEMLAAGKRVDEIFQGPLLEHGFIEDESLERLERRDVVHTSDLIRVIMGVPGVRAVRRISVSSRRIKGGKPEPWSLDLEGGVPSLELAAESTPAPVTLWKGGVALNLNARRVKTLYDERRLGSRARGWPTPSRRDILPPPGRDRNIARYYSIQHQFPEAYGIGAMGLPDSAAPERKARAKQLKAYLLFFDQILANDFAQLAHLGELFSFDAADAGAYATREIDDPSLGLEEVLRPSGPRRESGTETDGPTSADLRRNRFLNHLLARFAEQFPIYSPTPMEDAGSADASNRALIRDKQEFLRNIPRVSGGRGTAFNYLEPWDAANRSGLEERIRLKLGIGRDGPEQFLLIEHILLRPLREDRNQVPPVLADVRSRDPYSLQLSFVFPLAGRFETDDSLRLLAEQTVREETPAHLTPYILWLEAASMGSLRDAYRHWLEALRAASTN